MTHAHTYTKFHKLRKHTPRTNTASYEHVYIYNVHWPGLKLVYKSYVQFFVSLFLVQFMLSHFFLCFIF